MNDFNDYTSPYVIIDMGSSTIKCGFSGENYPRVIIPNVYAIESQCNDYNEFQSERKVYYGNDAFINCTNSRLTYPQRINKLDNYSDIKFHSEERLEGMFCYLFRLIGNKQQCNNVFIIDSLFTPLKVRRDLAKLLFDTFSVANLRIEPQEIMTLYSTSKQSGLIVETGELNTTIVPIYQGYVVNSGVVYNDIAGEFLTKQYLNVHRCKMDFYNVNSQYEEAKKIKEKFSEVLLDPSKIGSEAEKFDDFKLPDGNIIKVGDERYKIPELMFNPLSQGIDRKGIHEMINESISKCDSFIRSSMYSHIILGGGNTMIKNFPERLKKEIEVDQKKNYYIQETDKPPKIDIEYSNDSKYSAWIGASGICSLRIIQNKWLSRNDIEETNEYEGEDNNKKDNALEQKYIYL